MAKLSKKTLYKCVSKELMHVAAWYHGTPGPKFSKFGEYVSIRQTPNIAEFPRATTKNAGYIR